MESPAAAAADAKNADRRMSLGKYMKRMSSVFKKEKPADKASVGPAAAPATPSAAAAEAGAAGPHGESAMDAAAKEEAARAASASPSPPAPVTTTTATATTMSTPTTTTTTTTTTTPTTTTKQVDRRAMQQERARALFAKYGLTLEAHEWAAAPAPAPTVQRVEKAIRMRVHRNCHRCGTVFGAGKLCLQCEHKRCNKCPRYPKKKTPEDKLKLKLMDAADKPKRKKVLTILTRAGDELAYSPPRQRIRRYCHKCETLFVPASSTICESCRHIRCTKCPRDPAKLTKWPAGYPGDAEAGSDEEVEQQLEKFRRTWRKPRARVRWECEKCHHMFVTGSPQCPGCGHERCDRCTRSPVKKANKDEQQFDPAIVAAVEAKLRALGVDDSSVPPSEVEIK
ncbi:hypothetical protein ACN47E_009962 [Coniothyrium glycines]